MPYGCQIHTFDHTVDAPNPPNGVTFHSVGAAAQTAEQFMSLRDMATLAGVSDINVLKIVRGRRAGRRRLTDRSS